MSDIKQNIETLLKDAKDEAELMLGLIPEDCNGKACFDALCDALEEIDSEVEDLVTEKDSEIDKLKDEVKELEDEAESQPAYNSEINSRNGTVFYAAPNLLDQQIMEAFGEIMAKMNPHELLEKLSALSKPYEFSN